MTVGCFNDKIMCITELIDLSPNERISISVGVQLSQWIDEALIIQTRSKHTQWIVIKDSNTRMHIFFIFPTQNDYSRWLCRGSRISKQHCSLPKLFRIRMQRALMRLHTYRLVSIYGKKAGINLFSMQMAARAEYTVLETKILWYTANMKRNRDGWTLRTVLISIVICQCNSRAGRFFRILFAWILSNSAWFLVGSEMLFMQEQNNVSEWHVSQSDFPAKALLFSLLLAVCCLAFSRCLRWTTWMKWRTAIIVSSGNVCIYKEHQRMRYVRKQIVQINKTSTKNTVGEESEKQTM